MIPEVKYEKRTYMYVDSKWVDSDNNEAAKSLYRRLAAAYVSSCPGEGLLIDDYMGKTSQQKIADENRKKVIYQEHENRQNDRKCKGWDEFFEKNKLENSNIDDILGKIDRNKYMNFEGMSPQDLIAEADSQKNRENFSAAYDMYLLALEYGSSKDARATLARITSCCRKINRPRQAVKSFWAVVAAFGEEVITSEALTSLAATYNDVGRTSAAWICADQAKYLENGKISMPLQRVYARLRYGYK